jgi:hypothetical protein
MVIVAAMSGDPNATPDAPGQRTRLLVAVGAAAFLGILVAVVTVSGGGGSEEAALPSETCFRAWNEDPLAPAQDGIHAFNAHGYRQVLVTRLDREGEVAESRADELAPDDPTARCAVVFASPQVDDEPEFGVRVFEEGLWTGLTLPDGPLERIAELQSQAVSESNAVLRADGTLSEG